MLGSISSCSRRAAFGWWEWSDLTTVFRRLGEQGVSDQCCGDWGGRIRAESCSGLSAAAAGGQRSAGGSGRFGYGAGGGGGSRVWLRGVRLGRTDAGDAQRRAGGVGGCAYGSASGSGARPDGSWG